MKMAKELLDRLGLVALGFVLVLLMGAATDNFATFRPGLSDPCTSSFACVQHQTNTLTRVPRMIRFDAAGDVKLGFADGTTAEFTVLPGETLPLRPNQVYDTGTSLADADILLFD